MRPVLLFPFLVSAFAFPTLCAGQGTDDINGIFRRWKGRQEKVERFMCEWNERVTLAAGSLMRRRGDGPSPPTDETYDLHGFAFVDAGWLAYRNSSQIWSPELRKMIDLNYQSSSYKDGLRLFLGRPAVHPLGYRYNGRENVDAMSYHLRPILLAFRPFEETMGKIDANLWRLSRERGTIADESCLVLEQTRGHFRRKLWVSPSRDYVPLRAQDLSDEHVVFQMDIKYVPHSLCGWAPSAWTSMLSNSNGARVAESAEASGLSWTFNQPVDSREFDFDFPVGTFVNDGRASPHQYYIVRPGGMKREVTQAELRAGVKYEGLVATEPKH